MTRESKTLILTFKVTNREICLNNIKTKSSHYMHNLNCIDYRSDERWARKLIEYHGCEDFFKYIVNPAINAHDIQNGEIIITGKIIWHAGDFIDYYCVDIYLHNCVFELSEEPVINHNI